MSNCFCVRNKILEQSSSFQFTVCLNYTSLFEKNICCFFSVLVPNMTNMKIVTNYVFHKQATDHDNSLPFFFYNQTISIMSSVHNEIPSSNNTFLFCLLKI